MLSNIAILPLIAYVTFSKGRVAVHSENHLPFLGLSTSFQASAITLLAKSRPTVCLKIIHASFLRYSLEDKKPKEKAWLLKVIVSLISPPCILSLLPRISEFENTATNNERWSPFLYHSLCTHLVRRCWIHSTWPASCETAFTSCTAAISSGYSLSEIVLWCRPSPTPQWRGQPVGPLSRTQAYLTRILKTDPPAGYIYFRNQAPPLAVFHHHSFKCWQARNTQGKYLKNWLRGRSCLTTISWKDIRCLSTGL